MPDREKVIKAIDICLGHGKCDDCGYRIKGGYSTMDCRKPMMRDALAMLKEQETKRVNISQTHCGMKYGLCPRCEKQIDTLVNPHYCGNCGQELKWE